VRNAGSTIQPIYQAALFVNLGSGFLLAPATLDPLSHNWDSQDRK